MFRLIKLAFYAAIGYALYELYQGMTAETASPSRRGSWSRSGESLGRALNEAGGRMETLTDRSTGGMRQSTLDPDGASTPHRVGRGVVTR